MYLIQSLEKNNDIQQFFKRQILSHTFNSRGLLTIRKRSIASRKRQELQIERENQLIDGRHSRAGSFIKL